MDNEKDSIKNNEVSDEISECDNNLIENQSEEQNLDNIEESSINEENIDTYEFEEIEKAEVLEESLLPVNEKQEDDEVSVDSDTKEDTTKPKKSILTKKNVLALGLATLVMSYVFINMTVSRYDQLVYPGTYLYTQDISGLNKVELTQKIDEVKSEINKNNIIIGTKSEEYAINLGDAIGEYGDEELVDEILNKNSHENTMNKFFSIVSKKEDIYKLDINLDDKKIQSQISTISEENKKVAKEPSISINKENIEYIDGEIGEEIDIDDLSTNIEKGIIHENIYENDIKIEAKYVDDNPNINIEDLKMVKDKISTYSTTYSPGGGRGYNVELAAKKIDDLVLMPGEEFSYEESVGPVTEANGYTYANVISNGEFVPGIGGGVCQVSSTLYNTQLNAGILPTERRNHSKPVGYVPRGLDATLASGSIDYKFKNTYDVPVVINTSAGGGLLTIEFWSNEEVLNNIAYKPVGYLNGNTANTYLYGYDKEGNKVYEKHVDTSIYR